MIGQLVFNSAVNYSKIEQKPRGVLNRWRQKTVTRESQLQQVNLANNWRMKK